MTYVEHLKNGYLIINNVSYGVYSIIPKEFSFLSLLGIPGQRIKTFGVYLFPPKPHTKTQFKG